MRQHFFDLLHEARELKRCFIGKDARRMYLLGMRIGQVNEIQHLVEKEINLADPNAMDAWADRRE